MVIFKLTHKNIKIKKETYLKCIVREIGARQSFIRSFMFTKNICEYLPWSHKELNWFWKGVKLIVLVLIL